MARLKSKVAIITGAGEGIGKAIARVFSQEGAKLVLAGRRRPPLQQVADELQSDSLIVPTDVTDEDQVSAMVGTALKQFGCIDILINNAAQPGKDLHVWEQTLDNWNNNIAVNVTGPMLCSREVLRQCMLEQKSGVIVNFSSFASWNGRVRKSHYCVSKSGLRLLTKVTAMEAGPHNIRVNCVVPGGTTTELLVRFFERMAGERGITPEDVAQEYADATALKRLNTPEQVARAALFLASDDSAGMTGQSLSVDGGVVMVG